jgi:hypothetical protein
VPNLASNASPGGTCEFETHGGCRSRVWTPLTTQMSRGIPLTAERARRAKAKLAEAAARHTPERRAALLRRLGLPADAA